MKNWMKMFCTGGVSLALMVAVAAMAETEKDVTLGEVVVTATRAEQRIERVPANVTVIDKEDIKNSNAKNVVDLLRHEEGIIVRDLLGNGKTSQVDLRGFGEAAPANTLVLVDGRRVNEIDLSGVDWIQIPLGQIERIEIVRGTGSVLYGDNAVGGVINIITKTPAQKLEVAAGVSVGSYDRHKERAYVSGGRGNLAASLSASYEETDGYRENNEFRAKDVGGKIVFSQTELLHFNLSGSYHSDDFGLPSSLTETEEAADRKATTTPFDNAETTDEYVKFGFDLDLGTYGNIVTDLSYRDRKSEEAFESFTFASERDTDTWGVTPRYVWNGEILDHANTLIAGADFYWAEQNVGSFFGAPLAPSAVSDIERDSYGFYFNNEFSLLETLILSIGARRERVEYDLSQRDLSPFFPLAPLDDTVTERESAYSGGFTFIYGGGSSIFARANRSFRFPLTDELIVYDFFAGQILVNPDIKPQTGRHYEFGVRHYFTPQVQGNVTLFRAEIEDEIFFDATTFTNTNHPETLHQGVEIGGKVDLFTRLTLYGNYTYTKATFEKDPFDGNDVPAVPRHKGNLGFRVYNLLEGLVFSMECNYVGSSYAISDQANEFEKVDQYYTIDARLTYGWKGLKAFVGVNNLTDQEYTEYAAIGGMPTTLKLYPAPERNWVGGLEFTF
jgi:iron complex outermembrane receptor protein